MRSPTLEVLAAATTMRSTFRLASATVGSLVDQLFPWSCVGCAGDASAPVCPPCLATVAWSGGPSCERCGVPFASGPDRPCGRCLDRPPAFARARAIVTYVASSEGDDPIGRAIRAFKYGKRRGVGRYLAHLLAARSPYAPDEHDLLVPVPLEIGRLRERGFNQTSILARSLSRRCRTPVDPLALARARPTATQTDLDEKARRANLRGAIVARRPEVLRDRRILLIDDVVTTGATADACARALLGAGATSVDVLALARAPLRSRAS